MAGHSKWANIKFRKSKQDEKRGKIFTTLIKEIVVAARLGGPDDTTNPRLRYAVVKALKANMKRDTIDNAIKRGVSRLEADNMFELRYEGYGPGGIAVLVDCLSNNKNRTVSDVRHAFTKHGGNLGTDGSVAYLFNHQGEIFLDTPELTESIMEMAIEFQAEDVFSEEGSVGIIVPAESYHSFLEAVDKAQLPVDSAELTMRADITVPIEDEPAETLLKLIDMLEDLDDVQNVYTNAEFSDNILNEKTW